MSRKTYIVTGGAGFIGSNLVRYLLQNTSASVINIDKLTYAGNLNSLLDVADSDRYTFVQADIGDQEKMQQVFEKFQPNGIFHLAAESHVDRSIDGPSDFIDTNIVGTCNLLEVSRLYISDEAASDFRFLHVSTDEVYGSLGKTGYFTEDTDYDPRSPYSASKASSDHLVRAWHHTYDLPVLITNCSNNYGPYQFPEKLIPVVIVKALQGKSIPVYGDGSNVRDWLYVADHARALASVMKNGTVGETYNIGGNSEKQNIEVVKSICSILDDIVPDKEIGNRSDLITFVSDRPGHDQRYAIDASKIKIKLGWTPNESFKTGLEKTVKWYLNNQTWWKEVLSGKYKMERLGQV